MRRTPVRAGSLAGGLAVVALVLFPLTRALSFPPAAGQEAPAASAGQPSSSWRFATPGYDWSFPRDHGPHAGYKTEWWYFTGLLSEPERDEPSLGYQFTIFRVGVVPEPPASRSPWATPDVLMGHLAVTNLVDGTHAFREVLYRAAPPLARFGSPEDTLIAWSLAPPGTEGRWTLARSGEGFRIAALAPDVGVDLALRPGSELVFQGPGGFSPKSAAGDQGSMYYSYVDLTTAGTVTVGGRALSVTGTSWMDHEFSSDPLDADQVGWDWFSLRLDDGRAVMAFQLRDRSGDTDFEQLTLVEPDGSVRWVDGSAWSLEPERTWTSPATGAAYPVDWTLRAPDHGLELSATAILDEQENVSSRVPGLYYWEGAIRLTDPTGRVVGQGYLEMTGYGEGSRPAL